MSISQQQTPVNKENCWPHIGMALSLTHILLLFDHSFARRNSRYPYAPLVRLDTGLIQA